MLPKQISKLVTKKCKVIPNGLNDYWFENISVSKHEFEDEFRVIYAEVVNKNKNIFEVINIIEDLRKLKNITISIIGKG